MKLTNIKDPEYFHKVVDCQYACPAHTPVPEYIRMIAAERYDDAYMINWESNVFPGVLGRTCDRPCEPACRRGRVEEEPVAICRLKRVAADNKDDAVIAARMPEIPTQKNGKRIALIGAGPASLTVARDLLPLGYSIDIYDNQIAGGGMMRSQIPSFRLPIEVLDQEVNYILDMGAVTTFDHYVGSLKEILDKGYDAVFVGTGAPRGKDLELPGREEADASIHIGIDWLSSVAFEHVEKIAKRVIVMGGGNTAMDCCRTSRRLGGEDVRVVVRSPFANMKASPWEKEDAMHEDIPIYDNHVPKEFVVENGEFKGVRFEKVEAVYAEDGSRSLVPTGDDPVLMEADIVLMAIGQENTFPWIERDIGLEFGKWDMPVVDETTFQSTNERVFFGGDSAFGPENVITAVAHGHQAAISIDLMCRGEDVRERPGPGVNLVSQKMGVHEWSYDNAIESDLRYVVPQADKKKTLADRKLEVELGFDRETGFKEAERCLNCDVQTVFEETRCIECDACVDICPTDCITFVAAGVEEGVLRTQLTAPAGNLAQDLYVSDVLPTQRSMVKDEDVCLHCGLCAERCPTTAWDMQKFLYSVTKRASDMKTIKSVNDFVIKFANVNGTGSASANNLFAKALFRMGLPVSPKNIFPSNIQGLPTWYEVRVSEKGYLGRRGGVDIMLSVNPQSMPKDIQEVESGGYFIYDNTKPLDLRLIRNDVNIIGLPLTRICNNEYSDPRQRQLFKNVIYVGALAALLDIDFAVLTRLVGDQFKGKEKLVAPNIHALELGHQYARENIECPLGIRVEKRDLVGDCILIDGNSAIGLGAIYGGATMAAWYPITPSTSVVEAFEKYAKRMRIDPGTGRKNYAIVQAEDELAAIGMVIGASWNGARSFTATSGPGISLMSEFLGLAYFAEIPTVLIDVQRAGPSTGMPTRTQQSDVLSAAYASHGDTKQVLLFPSTPREAFDMTADSFDLAERLQTPIIILTDLDMGMNDNMSEPLHWDDDRTYDRGKVLSAEDLDNMDDFGRYKDIDGDAICYRTYPGTHPTKGAFFTRGTSRDEYAVYTESGEVYEANMHRLMAKWETAKSWVPGPVMNPAERATDYGVIFYGTSESSSLEALDYLAEEGVYIDAMRVRSFPFNQDVEAFIDAHERTFVIEQNRDAQLRTLLMAEFEFGPDKLKSVLCFDGTPISARNIRKQILQQIPGTNITPLRRETGKLESGEAS